MTTKQNTLTLETTIIATCTTCAFERVAPVPTCFNWLALSPIFGALKKLFSSALGTQFILIPFGKQALHYLPQNAVTKKGTPISPYEDQKND